MSKILNCTIFLRGQPQGQTINTLQCTYAYSTLCLTHTQNQAHKHFLTGVEALETRSEIGATAIHECRGREIMLSMKHHTQYTMCYHRGSRKAKNHKYNTKRVDDDTKDISLAHTQYQNF